ncbi:hypothetical protein [Bradyrhizobium sp.]|uniref:hypothetical protein n=1 Tax=Bradyrhizobium sp. TaxID=376 RepID=UPI00239D5375|nr:hypothetical protein [Bradyrhizobium sp.]MDE2376917.1 hypothetical protein [Bradyrhizobium sp.]
MLNFAGTAPVIARSDGDSHQLIVADLRNLVAQVETLMRLIDAATLENEGEDPSGSRDVVVLDDVTPRYAAASAALNACKVNLDLALQRLSESGNRLDAAAAPRLTA